MLNEEIEVAVGYGAKFLDTHRPGWAEKVDPEKLEMMSKCHCVLGQLYGYYLTGLNELGVERVVEDPYMLGFTLPFDSWDAQWDWLEKLWVEEIEARRGVPVES